jgi:beta-lactam-binding protein with PASTA domain
MSFSPKKFFLNLFLSVGLLALVIFLLFKGLGMYTNHSQSIEVPDMIGMDVKEAKKRIEAIGGKLIQVDSLYEVPENIDRDIKRGGVIMQNPKPHEKVKTGRRFYLTVRSFGVSMVEMPNLVDLSVHQAIKILESRGFILGNKNIPQDLPVSKQLFNGNNIKPGTKIPKGSTITLEVDSVDIVLFDPDDVVTENNNE